MTTSPALPNDLDAMRALLLAERARHAEEIAARQAVLARKDGDIEKLRLIIKALQRHRFGRRSEAIDPDQLVFALEEVEQTIAAAEAEQEKIDRAAAASRPGMRKANRGALPAHLPRVEIVIDVADKSCPCCAGAMHVIGEDRAERLDVIPAQFRVLVVRRPKYACRSCEEGVVQAPAPARLVESGIPTEALIAQVVVAKLAERLNASTKLFADETTAPVLDPGRGRTKTGQLWAYARDDRPWGGTDPPAVVYRYAPDRKGERPAAHLAGFAGVLQVDGYAGYRALADTGTIQLAFCWSHVRRRFYEMVAAGHAPIAAEALARINTVYELEREIRGCTAAARREVRQTCARPIIDALKPWLEAQLAAASKKSTLAQAIRYALSRWDGLTGFLDDGRIEIDSNVVERAIRPIALNRKNALFAGSDGGGEQWGILASLIETCKLNSVDPQAYLADVLTRLVDGHPMSRIDDLLPWAYAKPAIAAAA